MQMEEQMEEQMEGEEEEHQRREVGARADAETILPAEDVPSPIAGRARETTDVDADNRT